MVQVPTVTKVSLPAEVTVHTGVVADVKLTGRPELAVAVSCGAVPKVCVPGLLKVIDCGVTPGRIVLDTADGTLVNAVGVALLVAVTVNVYKVPLVSPTTAHGEAAQFVERTPPGLDVAV
jgi:hypothetical protein